MCVRMRLSHVSVRMLSHHVALILAPLVCVYCFLQLSSMNMISQMELHNNRTAFIISNSVDSPFYVTHKDWTPNRLVDCYHATRESISSPTLNSSRRIQILYYNMPDFYNLNGINIVLNEWCLYANCRVTTSRSELHTSDAIIFTLTEPMEEAPPIPKSKRNPNQMWIFYYGESPINHERTNYRHVSWRNTMNWSSSYELDADVFDPYASLDTRPSIPEKNYSAIFHRKSKMVAWAVSNCNTKGKREQYVSELSKYGLQVDVFGKCSNNKAYFGYSNLKHMLKNDYKFYLSFENSICQDYITEKYFKYFPLDTVLVVRGGLDYDKHLPNNTFINTANFKSPKHLAQFLMEIGSSEELYTKYLREKDKYYIRYHPTFLCHLCEKLNNVEKYRKTYDDHVAYIQTKCWNPTDIL